MAVELIKSKFGYDVPMFVPTSGVTLTSPVTLTEDAIYKLGASVDITLNSKTITYDKGYELGLRGGVTYTLSASVDAHKM